MMEEVSDEYDFLNEISDHFSPGTSSSEWMQNTFTDSYAPQMAETLHITSNTSSEYNLSKDDFLKLEEVWRYGWDEELGTIPADFVTDRAVDLCRRIDSKWTIIHYMQPHLPFVTRSDINSNQVSRLGVSGDGMNLSELHRKAGYDRETLWEAHIDNLRYVLDSVEILLNNLSAERVVISADHGQAFGEHGVWGHPPSTRVDAVRKPPWCVTSAEDSGDYTPEFDADNAVANDDLTTEEKLKSLGYL